MNEVIGRDHRLAGLLQQLRYPHQVLSEASKRSSGLARGGTGQIGCPASNRWVESATSPHVLSTVFVRIFKRCESRAERGWHADSRGAPRRTDYPVLSAPLQLPPFLYIRGRLSMPPETCISNGTRRPSPYGIKPPARWLRNGPDSALPLYRVWAGHDGLAHEIV